MIRHLVFFMLISVTLVTQGYSQNIDSLENVFKTYEESDTNYIKLLYRTGIKFWDENPQYYRELSDRALNISQKYNFKKFEGMATVHLGIAFWAMGDYDNALNNVFQGIKILEDENAYRNLGFGYSNLGLIYIDIKDYTNALKYCHKAYGVYTKLFPNNYSVLANSFNHIGAIHHHLKNYDSANLYYVKSLEFRVKGGYKHGIAESYNNLGVLFQDKGQPVLAGGYYLNSIRIKREISQYSGLASTYNNLGKLLTAASDFNQAKIYLDSALYFGHKSKATRWILESYEYLTEWAKKKGDYKAALKYNERYHSLNDSIFSLEKSNEIAKLEDEFESYQKQKEIDILEQENTLLAKEHEFIRARNTILVIGIVLLLILGTTAILLQRSRLRKKIQLQDAQRKLDQTQLENSRLREMELERQLEFKNKELASFTMNFIQKNELMQEIKETAETLMSQDGLDQDVKGGLKKLKQISLQNLNMEKDWEEFRHYFENVYDDFFTTLKSRYPDLTQNELKLAAMIRLNRNVKETANILAVSPESIKKARYRMRKKFDLQTDENLFDFLMTIGKKAEVA